MKRVLIVATTTGYQTRSFSEAADHLGVELVLATDRCHQIDDPWRDAAVPIRFHDEELSVRAIVEAARSKPIHGILAVGDRPTRVAALAAEALGVPGNPPRAADISCNKLATRECLSAADLAAPWFRALLWDAQPEKVRGISFPCVVKPLALSGSRGVIRANNRSEFVDAFNRLHSLLAEKDIQSMRDSANNTILVEGFVPGHEFALEGLVEQGQLRCLALFDKPDPLDGPFFEETIYVTPAMLPNDRQDKIRDSVDQAINAIGLRHGPIHAECRVNGDDVVVLEVAARPIGGLCARALRFQNETAELMSLEELLLRHALGEPTNQWVRETQASGVMMVPIPGRGIYRRVDGVDAARAVPGIEEVRITAKPDSALVPLPEGASYLGFIFARAETSDQVVSALRSAHAKLKLVVEREVRISAK